MKRLSAVQLEAVLGGQENVGPGDHFSSIALNAGCVGVFIHGWDYGVGWTIDYVDCLPGA